MDKYYAKAPKTTASLKLGGGDVVKAKKNGPNGRLQRRLCETGNTWCKPMQPAAFPNSNNRTSDSQVLKKECILTPQKSQLPVGRAFLMPTQSLKEHVATMPNQNVQLSNIWTEDPASGTGR